MKLLAVWEADEVETLAEDGSDDEGSEGEDAPGEPESTQFTSWRRSPLHQMCCWALQGTARMVPCCMHSEDHAAGEELKPQTKGAGPTPSNNALGALPCLAVQPTSPPPICLLRCRGNRVPGV